MVRQPGRPTTWPYAPSSARERLRERGFRLRRDSGERFRVGYREVGQHLAVELDPGLAAAGHELAVGEALAAGARVYAHDPEPPHDALLRLAVAVGVDERALDLLLREAVARVPTPVVAACLFEYLAALLAGVLRTLDARHYDPLR